MLAAMEAWQRRKAIEDIDRRRIAHLTAFFGKDYDPEKTDIASVFGEIEDMYEQMKDEAWKRPAEREQEEEEMDNDFMRASKRAAARSIEYAEPNLPGADAIQRLPQEPGEPW
jgi:hypothetical protein